MLVTDVIGQDHFKRMTPLMQRAIDGMTMDELMKLRRIKIETNLGMDKEYLVIEVAGASSLQLLYRTEQDGDTAQLCRA